MDLKLVTWNMGFWHHRGCLEESWNYFLEENDADIFLFQESRPPQRLKDNPNFLWFEIGGTRDWGTGIYSKKYPVQHLPIQSVYTGSLVVGEVQIPGTEKLTIISLYGLFEKFGSTSYTISTLHRMLSDLTGVLNDHVGGKRRIVLGGDLNASTQCDEDGGKAHHILFQRLEDFELMNCFVPFHGDHFVQTHRNSKSSKPWQNDYFFVSKTLSENLKYCDAIVDKNVIRLSDHNPVLMKLEL